MSLVYFSGELDLEVACVTPGERCLGYPWRALPWLSLESVALAVLESVALVILILGERCLGYHYHWRALPWLCLESGAEEFVKNWKGLTIHSLRLYFFCFQRSWRAIDPVAGTWPEGVPITY